jgi:sugar phosphate permease
MAARGGKWLVLSLIWLMMLVAYFDRVNIAVAGPTISAALGLGKDQFGWVLSAFTLGYALLQVPGGYLADRFGAKPLMVAALLVWSFFTAATGAVGSLGALLAVRVLFGFGEGLENGGQFKLIGDYFSPAERSRANAIFLSTLALGPAIGTPIAAWLLRERGWHELFYTFAGVGVVVASILALLLPKPTSQTHTPKHSPPNLKQGQLWICAFTYMLFNGAFWGFISWIPSYLTEARHLSLKNLGFLGAVPYLCGFVAMLVVGHLASTSLFQRRTLLLSICYVGAAIGLWVALRSESVTGSIAGLSVAAAFLYASFGPFWAVAIDLAAPETRGGLTGFVNFLGQIGGFVAQIAIGALAKQTGSFGPGLAYMMVSLVLAAVAATFIRPATQAA